MSRSDSLLFVIQYAIWRCNKHAPPPAEVQICAIDDSRFPKGQFARDMWLIHKYHNAALGESPLGDLIQLRERRGYYNGEHLSQGTVTHRERSSVFSLQELIDAGLYELYPQLNDSEGRNQWTKRVLALRSMWTFPSLTSQGDINLALGLAKSCFRGMPTIDIALMFLTFKSRGVRRATAVRTRTRVHRTLYDIQEPEDVQRYVNALDEVQSQVEDSGDSRPDSDILQHYFDCLESVTETGPTISSHLSLSTSDA